MPTTPAITRITISLGGTTLNGLSRSSAMLLGGTGQPGDSFAVFYEGGTQATYPGYPVSADGSWSSGIFPGSFLGSYALYFQDRTNGDRSPTVRLLVGTTGADTITGPTLGMAITGPTFLFGQGQSAPFDARGGDDTFVAYVVALNTSGNHATGAQVQIQGGTGTDTVVVPTRLAAVRSHRFESTSLYYRALAFTTVDAQVTVSAVERLRFDDATLTVQPDVLADFLYYDQRYPDLAAADVNARAHYEQFGWREGRDPDALFSTQGYLGAYGDVRAAGYVPLNHYDATGWREGRDPSALFDTRLYLLFNPDVARAGVDPLQHYLGNGMAEGRKSSPVVASDLVRDGFDPLYYKLANPDVGLAGFDALDHWQRFGAKEGRNPDAFFDTNHYLSRNPDVAASGLNALDHYDQVGWRQGRDPSSHFGTSAYLAANPDVAAAGVNPLQHFLQYGAAEGRSAQGDLY